jgi:DNA-binding transcriptional MerR regulator
MDKELPQIMFDFSDEDDKPVQKEFLSGKPIELPVKKEKSNRGRKSQKDFNEEVDRVSVPPDEVLFQKQYYGIGDVADMFGVNGSLLRYWEEAFGMKLRKNRKGDRFFRPEDIKQLQLIHDLLRRRKFTIEGAKDYLKKGQQADEKYVLIQSLQRMRSFLLELKAHL